MDESLKRRKKSLPSIYPDTSGWEFFSNNYTIHGCVLSQSIFSVCVWKYLQFDIERYRKLRSDFPVACRNNHGFILVLIKTLHCAERNTQCYCLRLNSSHANFAKTTANQQLSNIAFITKINFYLFAMVRNDAMCSDVTEQKSFPGQSGANLKPRSMKGVSRTFCRLFVN